jgi:hypothetical protein
MVAEKIKKLQIYSEAHKVRALQSISDRAKQILCKRKKPISKFFGSEVFDMLNIDQQKYLDHLKTIEHKDKHMTSF